MIEALGRAGAADVVVVNRTEARAESAAALAGPVGRVGSVDAIGEADIVINATSVGMDGVSSPSPGGSFTASQTVVDLIYRPLSTPWLTAARDVGANAVNGVGMLLHQAAIQLELVDRHRRPDRRHARQRRRRHRLNVSGVLSETSQRPHVVGDGCR